MSKSKDTAKDRQIGKMQTAGASSKTKELSSMSAKHELELRKNKNKKDNLQTKEGQQKNVVSQEKKESHKMSNRRKRNEQVSDCRVAHAHPAVGHPSSDHERLRKRRKLENKIQNDR